MCTVIIAFQPGADWPLIMAANRDEMRNRPWKPPGRHWPDRADVVAGLDELAGGSWLGVNDTGVVAAILNREGTLGPQTGKRSRGELVLEALDHADAGAAAQALADLNTTAYRPFNMIVVDDRDVYWLALRAGEEGRPLGVRPLTAGLWMLTAFDANDQSDPRIARYLPRFQAAPLPDPPSKQWQSWENLLGSRDWDGDVGPKGALCFEMPSGFGTSSAALIALPNRTRPSSEDKAVWRFCSAPPDVGTWYDVTL